MPFISRLVDFFFTKRMLLPYYCLMVLYSSGEFNIRRGNFSNYLFRFEVPGFAAENRWAGLIKCLWLVLKDSQCFLADLAMYMLAKHC